MKSTNAAREPGVEILTLNVTNRHVLPFQGILSAWTTVVPASSLVALVGLLWEGAVGRFNESNGIESGGGTVSRSTVHIRPGRWILLAEEGMS
jgi:hypothetical protein